MCTRRWLHVSFALLAAVPVLAGTAAKVKEEKPGLLAKATVKVEDARKAALAKVPKGQITAEEIEEEDGRLVFSFELKVKGRRGVEEVNVDAKSGAVVSVEHESPAQEAKEK